MFFFSCLSWKTRGSYPHVRGQPSTRGPRHGFSSPFPAHHPGPRAQDYGAAGGKRFTLLDAAFTSPSPSFICSAAYTGSPPHLDQTLRPEGESRSSLARAWAPRPATSQGWAAGGGLIRGGRPVASEGSRGVTCQHHAHLDPGGTWGWLHGCSDGQSFQIREHTCVRAHGHAHTHVHACA